MQHSKSVTGLSAAAAPMGESIEDKRLIRQDTSEKIALLQIRDALNERPKSKNSLKPPPKATNTIKRKPIPVRPSSPAIIISPPTDAEPTSLEKGPKSNVTVWPLSSPNPPSDPRTRPQLLAQSQRHQAYQLNHPPPAYRKPTRKENWLSLSRRKRYIIFGTLIALVVLIIGVAAGVSVSNKNKLQNLPLPTNNGGPYTGDLTYYVPGLGACGVTSKESDNIVAVSHFIFDAAGQALGVTNPNSNPLCGKKIRARRESVQGSIDLTVVDRCTGCEPRDLDVTETIFGKFANVAQGRVDVVWTWLD